MPTKCKNTNKAPNIRENDEGESYLTLKNKTVHAEKFDNQFNFSRTKIIVNRRLVHDIITRKKQMKSVNERVDTNIKCILI